jgi:hypothetical protein
MDELVFRRKVYQIAVLLMKWQFQAPFILTTAIDILFSRGQQQKFNFAQVSRQEGK